MSTKLFRTLALVALLGGAATLNVSSAQEKAKPGKTEDDKKADRKKAKKGGLVKVTESAKNGKFYVSVRDADDKFLATVGSPGGFESKDDALKALDALKAALESPKIEYVTKKADDKDEEKAEKKEKKKGGAL